MDTEIRENVCMSVILRLNSNKELAADIVRNKVWLMFEQGKQQQTMYARSI